MNTLIKANIPILIIFGSNQPEIEPVYVFSNFYRVFSMISAILRFSAILYRKLLLLSIFNESFHKETLPEKI